MSGGHAERRSVTTGVALAGASAVAFGVTIPVVAWAGHGVGPFATAALLYAGAAAAALAQKAVVREAGVPLGRGAVVPLLAMALAGAVVAPVLFAWGLQRTGPVTSGLLLNLEAVWTAVLAHAVFKESLGRRVRAALALMVAGGALLALREGTGLSLHPLGAVAVGAAALGWAADNTVSRRLAEHRTLSVVAAKGGLGAATTVLLAWAFREAVPAPWVALALLGAGATGYGLSLRLYLLAQRKMGAVRTASVFAFAPFIGATLGLVVHPEAADWTTAAAGLLFVTAVGLHASERHGHRHRHEVTAHAHPHRHDDGHHHHVHPEPVVGEHSHLHQHEALEHAHEHGPDVHHAHRH